MKITKKQLRKIIREAYGQYTVGNETFDDLEAAKKEAEFGGFDVIDTSTEQVAYSPKKLPESRRVQLSKKQLKIIIREEVRRVTEQYWDEEETGPQPPEIQVGDDDETGDLVLFVDGEKMTLDDVYELRDAAAEDSAEYKAYEAGIQAYDDAMYES